MTDHPRHLREWYMDLDLGGSITHVWTADVEFTCCAVVAEPHDGVWVALVTLPDQIDQTNLFDSSADAKAWAETRLPL